MIPVRSHCLRPSPFLIAKSSNTFDLFMSLLAEKVSMKGWTKYAGGLSTKRKSS